ncbi:hypothetical protein, partial [Salmonella enterica]|uniref:hypothetical protein n=1 Tax=Salmonella enterica TaxID=28901 RepID=UPI00122DA915
MKANEFLTQSEINVNTADGLKLSEHEMESLVRDNNDNTKRILAGNEALTLEDAAMRAAKQHGAREQQANV